MTAILPVLTQVLAISPQILGVPLGFLLVVRPEPEGEFGAIMWGVLVGMPIGGVVAIRMLKRWESRKLG